MRQAAPGSAAENMSKKFINNPNNVVNEMLEVGRARESSDMYYCTCTQDSRSTERAALLLCTTGVLVRQ